jgi:hypothetical protein
MELIKQVWTDAAVEEFELWQQHASNVTDMDAYVVGTPEELADIAYEQTIRLYLLPSVQEQMVIEHRQFLRSLPSRTRSMEAYACLH